MFDKYELSFMRLEKTLVCKNSWNFFWKIFVFQNFSLPLHSLSISYQEIYRGWCLEGILYVNYFVFSLCDSFWRASF